ncbi:MAG: hypothetical protein NT051_06385 [Candidatus Micrarchaeota archaeon]|nr:hypothetical protein [Candidatus Micrarchaeota archaeon]
MLEFLAPTLTLPGFEFRAFFAVALTAAAAYYDVFNKKWVPDWLAYSCVAAALALNIIFFTPAIFLQAILIGGIIFVVTFLLYKTGQLGGADMFVMSSVAALIPFLPAPLLTAPQNVPYPFILSVMVPCGIAFILHMFIRFIPYISKRISSGKVHFTLVQILQAAFLLVMFFAFILLLSSLPFPMPSSYLAVIAFLFLALIFFTIFKSEIKDSMISELPLSKLCEEDVLALEHIDKRAIKSLSLSPVLDSAMIARIRKSKLKHIPVYTGMPFFLPYFLIGVVFTLLFGDLLYLLF